MDLIAGSILALSETVFSTLDTAAATVSSLLSVSTIAKSLQLLAITSNYVNQSWPDSSVVNDGDRFDFIICGGGTAGLVLANRLSEIDNVTVGVFEAGADPPLFSDIPGLFPIFTHSQWDWDFYNEYQNTSHALQRNRVALTRGKLLGGSSSIDHLLYDRGNIQDYENWASYGFEEWNWENCIKYFKKLEKLDDIPIFEGPTAEYHCNNGVLGAKNQYTNENFKVTEERLLDGFTEIGIKRLPELTGPDQMGASTHDYRINTNPSTRASSAQNYYLPFKNRKNLYIIKNTQVLQVLINSDNEAVGVSVKTGSGNEMNIYCNKEVIISTGVYNTAKLLQLSGIGPKSLLEKHNIDVKADLPVGENLQDHAFVPMGMTGKPSVATTLETVLAALELSSFPLPLVSGSFSLTGNKTVPDIQFITAEEGALPVLIFYLLYVNFNYGLEMALSYFLKALDRQLIFSLVYLPKPKSRGYVQIRSSNPDDAPIIVHNYLENEIDLETITAGVRKMFTLSNTTYYKSVGAQSIIPPLKECDDLNRESDEYWRCYAINTVSTTFHPTGTCKMALKEKGGVVDGHLRVYGISNLRVVDDSIMPEQPSAKTAAVVTMIAEKAADIIKEDQGLPTEEFVCQRP